MQDGQKDHEDGHHGGLAQDLPLLTRRGLVSGLGLALLAGGGAWLLAGGRGLAGGEAEVTGQAADGSVCVKDPAETAGPYPADGSNSRAGRTVNVLAEAGVEREDLRPCFNGLEGVANGIPLTLEIRLVSVSEGCAPLAGHAIYLWHADAEGRYSLYDLEDKNWLRGVVVTDAQGVARVTTILPGCYDGRWPHIHFEVFSDPAAAVAGKAARLTSQFALPEAALAPAYAGDARYAASVANLAGASLSSDMVFGDNTEAQLAQQMVALEQDGEGFAGRVTVGI